MFDGKMQISQAEKTKLNNLPQANVFVSRIAQDSDKQKYYGTVAS